MSKMTCLWVETDMREFKGEVVLNKECYASSPAWCVCVFVRVFVCVCVCEYVCVCL